MGLIRLFGQLSILLLGIMLVIAAATASDTNMNPDLTIRIVREFTQSTDISAAAWSPDGTKLATLGNLFRSVTLRDLETGDIIHQIEVARSPPGCNSLAFTSDGRFIVTTEDFRPKEENHAAVVFWNVVTGELARRLPGPFPHRSTVSNASHVFAVSHTGQRVALRASSGRDAVVALYTGPEWASPILLPSDGDAASSMDFSPDGSRLAVGTIGGRMTLFDLSRGKSLWSKQVYGQDEGGVKALAFSPDGRSIATGFTGPLTSRRNVDGRLEPAVTANPLSIWDADTGNFIGAIPGTTQKIWSLSWSRNGSALGSAEEDHKVRIRLIAAPTRPIGTISFSGDAMAVAFAPDSARFVAVGGTKAVIGEIGPR